MRARFRSAFRHRWMCARRYGRTCLGSDHGTGGSGPERLRLRRRAAPAPASRPQRTTVELLAAALGLSGAERDGFLAAARGQVSEEPLPPTAYLKIPPAAELIGRADDVAELAARLGAADGPRGVTLVGIAG